MKVVPRVRGGTTVARLALVGIALLLTLSAYYPFTWDPLRIVRNEVTRTADGFLRFGEMNEARTPGTPGWLADARRSGIVQINLEVDPQSSQEQSPASIMMLASDFWHTDFAIGQDHSELLVWLRRSGSDANGSPPLAIGAALQSRRWNSVDVMLQHDGIQIDVNGTRRLAEHLPADSLRAWGPGQIALGDEVHGGGPWQGKIRHAEVHTLGHVVDYIRPGALSIPEHYLYLPDHIAPFPPLNQGEWLALVLHLLSFIPVGFVIVWAGRPPVRPISATLLATALAVVLAAGKFLFHGRHTEVADIVVQSAGALFGTLLAWLLAHRQVRARSTPISRKLQLKGRVKRASGGSQEPDLLLAADSRRGGWSPVQPAARQRASSRALGLADAGWWVNGRADQALIRRRELRYGSREFLAASNLARRLPYSPRISALIGNVVRDPALIRALVAVWRLPVVDLRVQRADADAWFGAYFGPASRGRLAQAVLDLPTVEEHYLAGRPKQALRTNLRHARDLRVTSERLPTYEAWFKAASTILHARLDGHAVGREMDKPEPGQHVAYYVARDAHEAPLAFAGVALFGQFAVLFTMLSQIDHPSASWARYQLHTFLALDLGRCGVKHLLVGSALRETVGNQYFQHLLGYRARNLRVEVIESGAT